MKNEQNFREIKYMAYINIILMRINFIFQLINKKIYLN